MWDDGGVGPGWGGGHGSVHLCADWMNVPRSSRNGWSYQFPAKAEQAAGDLVDVEWGRFSAATAERMYDIKQSFKFKITLFISKGKFTC